MTDRPAPAGSGGGAGPTAPAAAAISASILDADFGHLAAVLERVERAGIERVHLDIMDGHFVPNISFGPHVVRTLRPLTRLPFDVHLMIQEPSRYVDRFLEAGADTLTFHVEVPEPPETQRRTLERIAAAGAGPGLAVSPETPMEAVEPYLPLLQVLMVMTVRPGFGGQTFRDDGAAKLPLARALAARGAPGCLVHVDGGVAHPTAGRAAGGGAQVLVVGSALFRLEPGLEEEVRRIRAAVADATSGAATPAAASAGAAAVGPG